MLVADERARRGRPPICCRRRGIRFQQRRIRKGIWQMVVHAQLPESLLSKFQSALQQRSGTKMKSRRSSCRQKKNSSEKQRQPNSLSRPFTIKEPPRSTTSLLKAVPGENADGDFLRNTEIPDAEAKGLLHWPMADLKEQKK